MATYNPCDECDLILPRTQLILVSDKLICQNCAEKEIKKLFDDMASREMQRLSKVIKK